MKKKILAIITCAALALSLTGCGTPEESETPNENSSSGTSDKNISSTTSDKGTSSTTSNSSTSNITSSNTSNDSKPADYNNSEATSAESYDVYLMACNTSAKIKTIQEVRILKNMQLAEAKAFVESAPVVIASGLSMNDALDIKSRFEKAGAEIKVQSSKSTTSDKSTSSTTSDKDTSSTTSATTDTPASKPSSTSSTKPTAPSNPGEYDDSIAASAELFIYEEEDGGILIGRYKGSDKKVIIPHKIEGKPVTIIGRTAFDSCESVTEITIPDSVKIIDEQAFAGCISLTSITIPGSVTEIDGGAFMYCYSLTDVTIPAGVTEISDHAFFSCTSLTDITIPNRVTEIEEDAFYGCTSLKSVTIPDSVTEIGEKAFDRCKCNITYKGKTYSPEQYEQLYAAINGD